MDSQHPDGKFWIFIYWSKVVNSRGRNFTSFVFLFVILIFHDWLFDVSIGIVLI